MMHNKLYLLLAILFVFIICSTSIEQKSRKDKSASDAKKKVVVPDKYDVYDNDKVEDEDDEDTIEDQYISQGSPAYDRYSSYTPSENNYRTRSRWPGSSSSAAQPSQVVPIPSAYEEFMNEDDWSPFGYGNAFPNPSSSVSFDSMPMLNNGPTCNSLIDQQYPLFSDTCGAVPQARYSLPNVFGHRDRWQIAQILNSLIGASSDPVCTRSLRLLLCPVLFPPCQTRREPPPVLPCQSYCRAIKTRCAIPMLDLLPCEVLPYSSDLCPTNQPYGPFSPQGGFPSRNQQFPMAGSRPASRPFPSLQSILSSPALQAALSGQGFPSPSAMQDFQSAVAQQNLQSGLTSSPFSQASSPSGFTSGPSTSPLNLYNGGPYATDSLSPMLADYSSRSYGDDYPSRSYTNDYRQNARYAPLTRSSSETRPSNELRPSSVSSIVRA